MVDNFTQFFSFFFIFYGVDEGEFNFPVSVFAKSLYIIFPLMLLCTSVHSLTHFHIFLILQSFV